MSTYLDASFTVSLYHPDKNSLSATAQMQSALRPLLISSLCEVETLNAFRLAAFRKSVTEEEGLRSLRRFNLHMDSGILARIPLPGEAYPRAEQLSSQYTAQFGTRGADIVHVACALEIGAANFFSFDLLQRKLASAVGLVLNSL